MDEVNWWLIGGGLSVGVIFGALMQRSRFCMVAATRNMMLMKDYRQAFAFVAAWVIAIGGTQLLELMEIVDIGDSFYRNSTLDWFGASLGGVLFGVGATMARGGAIRTITASMEGNLHALLALLMFAIVGAVTQFGFLETARVNLTNLTAVELQTDAGIASMLSLPAWLPAAAVVLGLVAFLVFSWRRGGSMPLALTGIVIGGLVVASWYITGVVAQDEFDPTHPSAMTVSGPMARLGYILISGKIPAFSFSISFVIGAAIAALISAVATGQFRITPIQKGMTKYSILGGILMGIGGVVAYGCNVGQGLSGISTLSVESLLAVLGMIAGTTMCVKWWDTRY
ncbi:MAG: YeeE/YedE family protein [Gammaproteobacteria bacterium]|nr:MAG: YeeE/YedE family protein [Gammaproteobacteria bacterium]